MRQPRLKLTLRPDPDAQRGTDAWFIPGETASVWLNSLLATGCSTNDLQFRTVSDGHGYVAGSIVTGIDCAPNSAWLPYSRVADCLLVPVCSCFFPDVSEAELRLQLNSDLVHEYVWHPAFGLIGFERDQIFGVEHLLTLESRTSVDWNRAEPGGFLNDRLVSILPDVELSMEMIFEGGRDDIGSQADDLHDAPRSPDESSTAALQDLAAKMLSPLAHAARWLAGKVPATADSPTWINSIGDWAERLLTHAGISQSKRLNELRRLLSMLDSDPDQGLRYALPFGGDASRGRASPTNRLGSRRVDFGGQAGGGAADYWDMPYQIRAELIRRYRELALREVQLGRYRRAAYIHATLLDDYSSAAQVLMDGGFFREAAEIYRKRLRQPRKAAECLLRASLFTEAIEIYEELKDWSTVAEIHEKLEDLESARVAWQSAADDFERGGDFIQAAFVQETRLGDYVAAAELLECGWNHSAKKKLCLAELFGLFGRSENHASCALWMQRLASDDSLSVTQQDDVADTLADLSTTYPDGKIRASAYDHSRRMVAGNLTAPDARIRRRFLSVFQKLVPDDRLLSRDCRRYGQQSSGSSPQRRRVGDITHLQRISLRSDVSWRAATRSRNRIFVAGFTRDALVVASWMPSSEPKIEYNHWKLRQERQTRILLAPVPGRAHSAFLHIVELNPKEMDDLFHRSSVGGYVQTLPNPHRAVSGAGVGEGGIVWTARVAHTEVEIHSCQVNGSPIITRTLPVSCNTSYPVALIQPFAGQLVACVIENLLLIVRPATLASGDTMQLLPNHFDTASEDAAADVNIEKLELPFRANHFCSFEEQSRPRLAVLFDEGGVVHWLHSSKQQSFGHALTNPVANFMNNEDLVVADEHGILEIYRTRNEQLTLCATLSRPAGRPIAVLPSHNVDGSSTNEFWVCRTDGAVDLFEYLT
jgi:tetratricopeptide (TPR) repeat protein